jgi:hypothetical protein
LFQRLKRWLSMLLWLVIAACLLLALGNPIFSLGRIKPRAIAVIIDNSASMQTIESVDGGSSQSRLELARRALNELTTRRPVNDEWLLIEAAREPHVLRAWTHDAKSIQKAGEAIAPFNGTGDLNAAVELANQLLAGKTRPCIAVISDGAAGAIEQLAKNDDRIVYWPVGQTTDNLGIERLTVRLHQQQSAHYAFVSVVNASPQKIDTQLVFKVDGVTTHVEPIMIEPEAKFEKTIALEAPKGGVLAVSIDRADALALDNQAFAILEPIRPATVWLVTPSDQSFFFEQALAAMDPLVSVDESRTLSIEQYESLAKPAAADAADLTIFNNCAPKSLPDSGRFLFINAWPAQLSVASAGMLTSPQLFMAPRAHPVIQYLNLQGVKLAQAKKVRLTDRATVLAQSSDGDPLMFLCDPPSAHDLRALCLAFDVLDSDLPFRNAFPLLLRNTVGFFSQQHTSWIRPQYQIGQTIESLRPLPPQTVEVKLARLEGDHVHESALPVHNDRFRYSDTAECGALRITIGDDDQYAAINLSDGNESRIGPAALAKDPAQELMLSGRLFGTMPWIGLAAAAAVLITLEWLTFHFRWTE